MSLAVRSFKPNFIQIYSLNGTNKIDLVNSLLFFDYYEDILSPCITATMQIMNSTSIFNLLPIRGGEKVEVSFDTGFGNFEFSGDRALYVYKVSGINQNSTSELFTLHLVSREGLTNETSRCQKKYEGNLQNVVTEILEKDLMTKKFKSENIENTANTYSFIGNNRKPFYVLTWLGPKGVPTTGGATGVSGEGESGKAKGTAGFLFYENIEGFNFRSIDTLVSNIQSQSGKSDKESIPKYVYTQVTESNQQVNDFKILNYAFEKNIDLMKALRVGLYANRTYFYDLYTNKVDLYDYFVKNEVKNNLGTYSIASSKEFGESLSRVMVRTSDRGALRSDGSVGDKERNAADMAKSYSRYNLLFTQALNMIVPCNVNLKVGDIILTEFPRIERGNIKQSDDEQSGNYLIKELRHHFESGQMVTSLRLVRDSYGLYGPKNK